MLEKQEDKWPVTDINTEVKKECVPSNNSSESLESWPAEAVEKARGGHEMLIV